MLPPSGESLSDILKEAFTKSTFKMQQNSPKVQTPIQVQLGNGHAICASNRLSCFSFWCKMQMYLM